jgi:hypothetical protein
VTSAPVHRHSLHTLSRRDARRTLSTGPRPTSVPAHLRRVSAVVVTSSVSGSSCAPTSRSDHRLAHLLAKRPPAGCRAGDPRRRQSAGRPRDCADRKSTFVREMRFFLGTPAAAEFQAARTRGTISRAPRDAATALNPRNEIPTAPLAWHRDGLGGGRCAGQYRVSTVPACPSSA